MKNDTTFVRMRSGDHLGDVHVEKGHLAPSITFFINCDRQKRFLQSESFLFESSWKNMKNDTTFVRKRSGDHLGDVHVEKGHLAPSINFFINCDIQKRFLQSERRRADLQRLPQIFQDLPGDLVMIFQ